MALVKALKTGLWSDPTVGISGAGPGDIVYSNGFSVTIDQDIEVERIQAYGGDSAGFAVSGGLFLVSGDWRVITANVGRPWNTTCLNGSTSNVFTLIGDVEGAGGNNTWHGVSCGATTHFIHIGNVITLHGASNSKGISIQSGELTGNYYGGLAGINSQALAISGAGNVIVNGNGIGGGPTNYGIYNQGTGTVVINGAAIPSLYEAGVKGDPGGVTIVETVEAIPDGYVGIAGNVRLANPAQMKMPIEDGSIVTLTNPGDTQDFPAIDDVRAGVIFKNGDLVGICEVPAPESVAAGVPVDDTVGIALITIAALLDALENDAHPMAERLRNVSTIQSTSSQLANAING